MFKIFGDVLVSFFEIDFCVGEMVVGDDEGAGVEVFGWKFLVDILANDVGAEAFAEAGDEIERAIGKFAEEFDTLKDLEEFVKSFLDLFAGFCRIFDELFDGFEMAFFDCFEDFFVLLVFDFCSASGVKKLVGGTAKSRDNHGELFAIF